MRPQVNNGNTKKLAGDRIVSRELKLLPFRQSGFDTSDQLADRHRRFCARCVRHVRFMALSCPLTLYRGTAKSQRLLFETSHLMRVSPQQIGFF